MLDISCNRKKGKEKSQKSKKVSKEYLHDVSLGFGYKFKKVIHIHETDPFSKLKMTVTVYERILENGTIPSPKSRKSVGTIRKRPKFDKRVLYPYVYFTLYSLKKQERIIMSGRVLDLSGRQKKGERK